jgi:hypothetical protein
MKALGERSAGQKGNILGGEDIAKVDLLNVLRLDASTLNGA